MITEMDTRQTLIQSSAKLFNSQGYKATSLSEICSATGLSKGAIYSHFGSKEGLERAALNYMIDGFAIRMAELIRAESDTKGKMLVILDFFAGYAVNPPYYGGCPMVNASVELDDSDSELKKEVALATDLFHKSIQRIIENGIKHGQVRPEVDASAFASVLFSATEGAIVLMKITGARKHLRDVVEFLKKELEGILIVS